MLWGSKTSELYTVTHICSYIQQTSTNWDHCLFPVNPIPSLARDQNRHGLVSTGCATGCWHDGNSSAIFIACNSSRLNVYKQSKRLLETLFAHSWFQFGADIEKVLRAYASSVLLVVCRYPSENVPTIIHGVLHCFEILRESICKYRASQSIAQEHSWLQGTAQLLGRSQITCRKEHIPKSWAWLSMTSQNAPHFHCEQIISWKLKSAKDVSRQSSHSKN